MGIDAGVICAAIRDLTELEFDYHGSHRVVRPYCHGATRGGNESLRAVQVGGGSNGFGFGKLWTVAEIANLRTNGRAFVPDDPDYNPDDSAMATIHCRVPRRT